ncbi:FAD-binding domain-containing protein [Hymenopellis radicata]|nr:FAD-binding domain-containing protein [Hymenopellis radicata]
MPRVHLFVALALSWTPAVEALPDTDACRLIQHAISRSSDVYYPGCSPSCSNNYTSDIYHWSEACMRPSLCSVEPGTAEDVGKILQILGSTRTPFAVKAGGHNGNPGFADTEGVQIALSRFSAVEYDAASQTVAVGPGLLWEDVYAALETYGVNVVGGRTPGVGVSGFSLGGGYSWLTNQHGLTLDTIVELELVDPSGTISSITQESNPDLFFALRGSLNNFGIVTKIVFQAYPQGHVWGGLIAYSLGQVEAVHAAVVRFIQEVTDPKAGINIIHNFAAGQTTIGVLTFYDAATPPNGLFDDFLNIPSTENDARTKSYRELIATFPGGGGRPNNRTILHSVPIMEHSAAILKAVINETIFWGKRLTEVVPEATVGYGVEPFLSNHFSHNTAPTAWPPSREVVTSPDLIQYSWVSEATDNLFLDSIRQSAEQLMRVAVADGQRRVADASPYLNYALYDVPIERLFGDNLERLREIKARVDPNNVMALTGGFKV